MQKDRLGFSNRGRKCVTRTGAQDQRRKGRHADAFAVFGLWLLTFLRVTKRTGVPLIKHFFSVRYYAKHFKYIFSLSCCKKYMRITVNTPGPVCGTWYGTHTRGDPRAYRCTGGSALVRVSV